MEQKLLITLAIYLDKQIQKVENIVASIPILLLLLLIVISPLIGLVVLLWLPSPLNAIFGFLCVFGFITTGQIRWKRK